MKSNLSGSFKGKILRIKKGFNPNSSSISSDVIAFFTTAAGVSALFAAAAGIVMTRFTDKTDKPDDENNNRHK